MKPMLEGQTLAMVRRYGPMCFWDAPNPDARQRRKEE